MIVSQTQVTHSINALREDLLDFKRETNQRIDRLTSDYSLQQNNSMNQKLIRMLRSQNLKSVHSSPTDEDMTNENDSSYGADQGTSSD